MTKIMNKLYVLVFFLVSTLSFSQEKISWVSIEEAEKMQLKNPEKPLFIDIYTDWCSWCKKMDKSTFQDKSVIEHINQNYIPVKFNAEQKENITFRGNEYKYMNSGRNGFNLLAYHLLQGQMSFPSYVLISSDGKISNIIRGYYSSKEFIEVL